jgi:hypothetical protein
MVTVCLFLVGFLTLFGAGTSMAGDRRDPAPKTSSRQVVPRSFIVRQQLDAEVRDVDGSVLVLKTKAGRLRLHGVDPALTLKKGDSVALDIALIRHVDPAGLPRRDEAPSPLLAQRLRASISSIQRTVEMVALNTSAGGLMLAVPADAIGGLRTGDSLWLELAVRPERDPSALPSRESRRRNNGFTGLLFMLFGGSK